MKKNQTDKQTDRQTNKRTKSRPILFGKISQKQSLNMLQK